MEELRANLYIVPTPIGNLKDITFRALEILKSVDAILAEDTRTTGQLLKHFEISKPLISHHAFNEHQSVQKVIQELLTGKKMALVSDAGTPVISDPGFLLVKACHENHLVVETLPGATAIIPALVNAGFPTDRFVFEGFLPHKKGRKTKLEVLAIEDRTMVFYESPHRLVKTLEQMADVFGPEREACVSRELSKLYEENRKGTLSDLASHYGAHGVKGEIVLVVAGITKKEKKTLLRQEEKE